MEEKDYSHFPEAGEHLHDADSLKKEPDLASYYAAAASAAASGREFHEEKIGDDASEMRSPESDTDEEKNDAADAEEAPAEEENKDAVSAPAEDDSNDISDDGSPHGPLDILAGKDDEPEDNKEDRNIPTEREPVPPYENTPAYAAFQAPEKSGSEDEEPEGAEDDEPMSILGHLNELRRRLFRIVIIVILGFVAFYGVSEPLYGFLSAPLQACMPEGSKLIYTSPQGAFFTYMKVALVASLFGTSPFSFYQLWAFIAPGLYREEKKAILPLAFCSSIFFLAGAAFCFFLVFPIAFQFFMGFATDTIVPMISVEEYLSFALKLLLAFGIVFEMPLFAYFLSRFGLLTPEFMRRTRRYAILVIFIVAAILTPPDVFSQCLMALPMLVLYEVSIYVSAMAYKKKEDKTEPQPAPDDEDEDEEEEKP